MGSYLVGLWADRRYERAPDSLLRAYGLVELLIAGLGLAVSLALPHLHALAATYSSYVTDEAGWFVLSAGTYVRQGLMTLAIVGPVSLLMGGTLTLLIRHMVRTDVETAGGWKIAVLYAVNTAGAAAGAFLTDFALVPAAGLRTTALVAVSLNVVAGVGALLLSAAGPPKGGHYVPAEAKAGLPRRSDAEASVALALAGFAAMGMAIVWMRHFTLLLGESRAVLSLVITIQLAGMAVGALIGGSVSRRFAPLQALIVVQALVAVSVLAGLASTSVAALGEHAGLSRRLVELWFNARPMLLEIGVPAMLMGCAFPIGSALVQHAEGAVGRRAGVLYFANIIGAVCGSLATAYVLLPRFGMQGATTVLALLAGLALAPLYALSTASPAKRGGALLTTMVSVVVVAVAIDAWLRLPEAYVLRRSLPTLCDPEKLLAAHEGLTEVLAVTELPGRSRGLLINGHPTSSTSISDQRYTRALAHIPLLSMTRPSRVLVIGFGVGNATHAATLHPSVEHVDIVDLSRDILQFASYFRDTNGGLLRDPRVQVFVNDGRQHLQMQPASTYDLITLAPPPISHAGVAALYSREFYELARTRLKAGGYLSGDRLEIDPERLARALSDAPKVQADLDRIGLSTVKDIGCPRCFDGSNRILLR